MSDLSFRCHYLVLHQAAAGEPPWERAWEIEHDPSCPVDLRWSPGFSPSGIERSYRCEVGEMVADSGLDMLDADEVQGGGEWYELPPGRWEIEAWRSAPPNSWDGDPMEWGLRVVRRAVALPRIAVSV